MIDDPNEQAIKKIIYRDTQAFVNNMWEKYQKTTDKNGKAGDYQYLASICEQVPFFENAAVGKEISRILMENNPRKNQDFKKLERTQREKDMILRIWDDYRSGNNLAQYDNIEVRRFISKMVGGIWTAEKVRDVIRERDKGLGKTS